MRWRSVCRMLAGCVFLASCGTERYEGGGGFGGETISGRVVDATGRPVAGALVRARTSRSLDAQTLAETSADDSGRFALEKLPVASLRLQISGRVGMDEVNALVERDPGRPTEDFVARPAATRQIRILDNAGLPVAATLQAYGLGAVASTDDSGMARLTGWPGSDLWTRVSPRNGAAPFDLFVPAKANGDLLAAPGWVVDDFEGSSTKTRLGLLIGGGWWYAASAGTTTDPGGANVSREVFGRGYDTTQAHTGRASLHAKFVFSPDNPSRYGLVGFHLGVVDGAAVDLSGMDSLVIWLKGNGAVRVDLVAREQGEKRVWGKSVIPGTEWTRFALVLTDFAAIDGGKDWALASTQALYLQFSVYGDTDFWLDDLRIFAKRLP